MHLWWRINAQSFVTGNLTHTEFKIYFDILLRAVRGATCDIGICIIFLVVNVANFAVDYWFNQPGATLKAVPMECQRHEIKGATIWLPGGGGGGGFEKNILALIFVKKNILASTQTKKNSLTLGMRKKITALLRDKQNQLSRWWKKIRPS